VHGLDPDGSLDSAEFVVVSLVAENEAAHSVLKQKNVGCRVARFSLYKVPKPVKMYQMITTKCTTWS
jgi:hypothetical protein